MKVLTTKTVVKLALTVLLAVQVPAVIAGGNNLASTEKSDQQTRHVIQEDSRLTDMENQRIDVKEERTRPQTARKTGGYVSIISVIVNDALGHANKDIRTRRSNAAGKISF